jgi:hypothetical protein
MPPMTVRSCVCHGLLCWGASSGVHRGKAWRSSAGCASVDLSMQLADLTVKKWWFQWDYVRYIGITERYGKCDLMGLWWFQRDYVYIYVYIYNIYIYAEYVWISRDMGNMWNLRGFHDHLIWILWWLWINQNHKLITIADLLRFNGI